jgi:hypothetical protein
MIASPIAMIGRLSLAATTAAIALTCAALALWVSFGALSFVDADDRAAYVGVLPPLVWLGGLLVAAGAVTFVARPAPRMVAPLWLSAVTLLPWVPLPMPLSVFIWTGHLLFWLWAAIAVALFAPAISRMVRSGELTRLPPGRAALLAGALSAVAFGLGTWAVAPQHPDGDEPHYLVITQSILEDRDLKIENNHREGDYRAYVSRTLKPDYLKRGTDGQIYSIHAPGLSLIVAPAFAFFGYPGVLAALCLVSAAASALAWLVAWRVTGDQAASWFGWATVALSVPFFFHASALFPDGLGAVLTLVALLPLIDGRAREPRWLVAVGAALGVLPWLSTRFVPLAVMPALLIAAHLVADRSRRAVRFAAIAVCPVISAAAFFAFYQIIYGTPNPAAAYGGSTSMAVGTIVRGAPGLLFDQQFGLIPNAPVFLCAFAGIVIMIWRGPRRLALEVLGIALPYYFVATSFYTWWGGTTAPARYVVPITLLLVVPAAWWFAAAKSAAARTASLSALVVSLFMTATIASVDRGALLFHFRDGMSRVALWLTPVVDLTRALPSMFQNPLPTVLLQTAVWLAAIASAVAAGAILSRRSRAAVLLGFGLTLEAATMAAVSWVWRSNRVSVATPHAAGPVVLRRYNPEGNQIAIAYRPFYRLETGDLPGRIVLARTLSAIPRAGSASTVHLPAGIYEVTGSTAAVSTGRLRLRIDRVSPPIADWDVASLGTHWKKQVALPVAVAALEIDADAAARRTVRDASIRTASLVEPPDGLDDREAKSGARYGDVVVFLLGGEAWMEPAGIWIAGGSTAEFAIAPDRQSAIQLSLRNGSADNNVTLESATWRRSLRLGPDEALMVQIPTDGRSQATPLRVAATNGFRPVDVDPKSEDERFLGVWIEPR